MSDDGVSRRLRDVSDALIIASGNPKNRRTAAIIAAAGSSERMGTPKLFLRLAGIPVIVHTFLAYEKSAYIDTTVCVTRPEYTDIIEEFRIKFGLSKLQKIVTGSDTRQKSIICGIEALESDVRYVAIADGARPLTEPRTIDAVCLAAYRHGAATAAFRASDTVKITDGSFIESTPDRSLCRLAATPQVFSLGLYRAAAYSAADDGFEGTDDNQLVERIGAKVAVVECSKNNIKITEPGDIEIAEAILSVRNGKQNVQDRSGI